MRFGTMIAVVMLLSASHNTLPMIQTRETPAFSLPHHPIRYRNQATTGAPTPAPSRPPAPAALSLWAQPLTRWAGRPGCVASSRAACCPRRAAPCIRRTRVESLGACGQSSSLSFLGGCHPTPNAFMAAHWLARRAATTRSANLKPLSLLQDAMASYSNIGTCLSIFGPGSSIVSAGNGGDTEVRASSGWLGLI